MINELIKRLRKAADALDELQSSFPADNPKAAKAIRKKVDIALSGQHKWPTHNDKELAAYVRKHGEMGLNNLFAEGFNELAKGKSEQALAKAKENNEPVMIVGKWKKANKKQADARLKANRKKLHWTQTPEGKLKMSAAQKKSWAMRKGE